MATYSWSYAPTDRAGCKGKCKEKIPKGAVRLGVASDGPGDYSMCQYRCLDCVTDKQIENIRSKIGGVSHADGFNTLSAEDQARVLAKAGEGPAPKAGGTAAARDKAKVKAKAAGSARPPPVDQQHSFLDKAKEYDFEAVRALVTAQPALVNVQPSGRWSALHQFAQAGEAEAVRFLLNKGADRECKTRDGKTPRDVATGECAALLAAEVATRGTKKEDKGEEEDEEEDEEMEGDGDAESEPDEEEEEDVGEEGKEDASPLLPTKRKAEAGESSSSSSAKKARSSSRPVDPAVPNRDAYSVVDDCSVLLNQTNVGENNNKFYRIQVLKSTAGKFYCWTHWGRVGKTGQSNLELCGDQSAAEHSFQAKFKAKSGVLYKDAATYDWKPVKGKYTLVETDEQEGAETGDSAPLGKLTPHQIEKGQAVLQRLNAAISKRKTDTSDLLDLSSEYYTFIPHDFGMKTPPAITTREMLEAEEELLKFYLRMGFEEMGKEDDGLTPISGVMDLELPKSLEEACAKVPCSAGDVKASASKGTTHSAKQSGNPKEHMEPHLYAAIMFYTSNAIYQQLNAALRSEDRTKIKRYFPYLRLLLEALARMPRHSRTLWRGVSVDLFDKYPKGGTVTWWGVSSCTADINVAKNFMKGCGGKCTLLTIKSKTAADISDITFFGNEKESLLAPGTRFTVLSSSRKGNTTEITLEEQSVRGLS